MTTPVEIRHERVLTLQRLRDIEAERARLRHDMGQLRRGRRAHEMTMEENDAYGAMKLRKIVLGHEHADACLRIAAIRPNRYDNAVFLHCFLKAAEEMLPAETVTAIKAVAARHAQTRAPLEDGVLEGTAVIHTDASRKNGLCGIGVVIEHEGRKHEFSESVPTCEVLDGELRAMLLGLERAQALGLSKMVLASDCQTAVGLVAGGMKLGNHSPERVGLVAAVRQAAALSESVDFRWVPRDENRLADRAAGRHTSVPDVRSS